ncbi:uncharacterized protein [Coffea arabica]|uniref:ATP-dependent DNA helicase n=1 Tax=Coffea arabica TaxID=13443 RepID=A0A6P6TCW0_COFAR|nr:uncharacterized protein LOC113700076 [Coffea arabica]XP_027076321.1 uncharacterized protein LOC113700076 [Coffea arabica]XP_027076322.1 uncharacterized protein LOC113700076 [Coffea arabica]XP_027076323.1 uncharacterized protein LOC113700076 [Coffea arabica]XP_027076324.1 uncharacterized protein LOC113700076 [Coffea arabica]
MDYNLVRRGRYAAMDKDKKDALLQRRRDAYAAKKNTSHVPKDSTEPAYQTKLYTHKAGNSASGSPSTLQQIDVSALASKVSHADQQSLIEASAPLMRRPKKYRSRRIKHSCDIPSASQQMNASASIPEPSDNHDAQLPVHAHELADLFDSIANRLNSKLETQSTPHHPYSSISPSSVQPSLEVPAVLPIEEGTCVIGLDNAQPFESQNRPTIVVNTSVPSRGKRKKTSRLDKIPDSPLVLPQAPDCKHCGAKRFHLEPPNFCCSGGEVSVVIPVMPYSLYRLFSGVDEESVEFRKNARTYNNNVAFTSFGAKYDHELTKNTKGVYTFRVQGQVYHLLNGLVSQNNQPTGIQLYFYDQEEELSKRLSSSPRLRESTLRLLMRILESNPYTKFFKNLRHVNNLEDHRIVLNCNPELDQRVYNLPTSSQVAAIWTESEDEALERNAHIQVYTHSNTSHRIQHYFSCYDTLQYPLLFPHGESGWHHGILRNSASRKRKRSSSDDVDLPDASLIGTASDLIRLEQEAAERGKKERLTVSAREYYCYLLQMREADRSMLLHTGRLLQQFVVDIYVKIETSRLDFHRKNQNDIRTEILQGVMDSIAAGKSEGKQVGRRVYLPSSFIGGPRDMRRRYVDAMALVQKFGKPDLFITMTCNTQWKEIQENLKYGESAQERPDLVSRVFRAKFEMLKAEILKKKIFGEVAACVHVIEFQKRGLPHAHILLILKPEYKLLSPEAYDRIVSAEIPDPDSQKYLYSLVVRHMMHGPCGQLKPDNVCMKNGFCKNHFPKDYCDFTIHSEDSYPHYRRRRNGPTVRVRKQLLDNRWVVPYNPYLLALFDCHMNVEVCSTVKLVKYLYKYVYKGHDRVSFHVHSGSGPEDIDEINEFQSGRWVAAAEAFWRIYRFSLNEMTPSVYTLQLHLPGQQMISFHKNTDLADLLDRAAFKKTMLTQFFRMNRTNKAAQKLNCLYREFPEYFVWKPEKKKWSQRKRKKVIGRMVTVSPIEGERYYLRLLLSHVRSPKSFKDLLTINGKLALSYREAAFQMGLLQSDTHVEDTLDDAVAFQMPYSLRTLFAILLVYCSPSDPKSLWEKYEAALSSDFERNKDLSGYDSEEVRRRVLQDINKMLEQMGKNVGDYHLVPDNFHLAPDEQVAKEIQNERNIPFTEEDLLLSSKLNIGQRHAYDVIMSEVLSSGSKSFFVDGPGGTGKTFLYRSILATLRSRGLIAIAVASSGVAASILPGGRTAHSRFKIPLDVSANKICQISKQSSVARLITLAKLILWDEASMTKKDTVEAFDLLLKDVMDSNKPFGGKVVVFGGDFRQTLPVIPNASRDQQIEASFVHSPLWRTLQKITLEENMRAISDPQYSEFLLRVGEGHEPEDDEGKISLRKDILIPFDTKDGSLNRLIGFVFSDLHAYSIDPYAMINRCILTPKNSCVDDINDVLIDRFPGQAFVFMSTDRTLNEKDQGDYQDFLNSLNPKGLPPHKLVLKENCPVILLRNLNPAEGLCNGTRLICKHLRQHALCAEIAVGQHRGKRVILPRIPLQTSDNEKNGIPFKRTQFPVKLCFAMTINKSQGQTLDRVGIYLREPVFSHGQLYVALSRAKMSSAVRVLIMPPTFFATKTVPESRTRNVVYRDILELAAK